MIRFAKLPLEIAIAALQNEVQNLLQHNWQQHYNKEHYEGTWNVLALRAPGGDSSNPFAEELTGGSFADTALMNACPVINNLLHAISCDKMAVRLLNLQASALIKEHRDTDLAFEKGEARLHIPVFTNPAVEFHLDNQLLKMQPGECWYINANLPHRLANGGQTDRIHLVIDCRVNPWLQEFFARPDTVLDELTEAEVWQREKPEKIRLMDGLRLQDTPVARQLADEIEQKLKQYALL